MRDALLAMGPKKGLALIVASAFLIVTFDKVAIIAGVLIALLWHGEEIKNSAKSAGEKAGSFFKGLITFVIWTIGIQMIFTVFTGASPVSLKRAGGLVSIFTNPGSITGEAKLEMLVVMATLISVALIMHSKKFPRTLLRLALGALIVIIAAMCAKENVYVATLLDSSSSYTKAVVASVGMELDDKARVQEYKNSMPDTRYSDGNVYFYSYENNTFVKEEKSLPINTELYCYTKSQGVEDKFQVVGVATRIPGEDRQGYILATDLEKLLTKPWVKEKEKPVAVVKKSEVPLVSPPVERSVPRVAPTPQPPVKAVAPGVSTWNLSSTGSKTGDTVIVKPGAWVDTNMLLRRGEGVYLIVDSPQKVERLSFRWGHATPLYNLITKSHNGNVCAKIRVNANGDPVETRLVRLFNKGDSEFSVRVEKQ